jgi:hypothetical protein
MRSKGAVFTALLSLFVILWACKSRSHEGPRYIFLITLDTTRADVLNWDPQDNDLTPNLAELASEGINFVNAYALIPITLPSHAAMFYSLPPHILKIYNNTQRAEVPLQSVAEILDKKGYRTGAVISLGTLEEYWGLAKGFDDYIENFRDETIWFKTAEEVNQDAMALISKRRKKRSFFWIHYSDPHEPYLPPSYRGGRFRVKVDRTDKMAAASSEITRVELALQIPPGDTSIELVTELPSRLAEDPGLEIDYINFEGFSLRSDSGIPDLAIDLPNHWRKKEVKDRVEYSTRNLQSDIVISNPTSREISAQLKFSHKIIPTVASMRILYNEEIRYMDSQIGLFIEFLKAEGIYENSVFILMGDHGEGLGEFREHIGHIDYLYKPYSYVPLLLWGEGIPRGQIVTEPVCNLHIAPTILEIVGLEPPEYMLGESLTGPVQGKRILLETYSPEAIRDSFSVIDYPFQLIYYPDGPEKNWEFFRLDDGLISSEMDLEDASNKEKFTEMKNYLKPVAHKLASVKRENPKLPKRAEEMLKSLGYIK